MSTIRVIVKIIIAIAIMPIMIPFGGLMYSSDRFSAAFRAFGRGCMDWPLMIATMVMSLRRHD